MALAEIYAGGSRSDAARIGGVGLQLRDWVLRFNAEGPRGPLNGKAPGTPNIVDDSQRQALRHIVEGGPMPAVHGVVRWRLIDLAELNPVENIWQFLRQNHLSNRVFKNYNDLLEACCAAWNALVAEPRRIASIATRDWASVIP